MNAVKRRGVSRALIETCFIDDADDMKLYLSKKTRVAQAIAQDVAEGFGLMKKPENTSAAKPVKPTQKPANEELLIAAFNGLYNLISPLYTSLAQVPDYWRQEVSDMMKSGAIKGDGKHEISIRREALQSAVVAYRMMKNK